MAKPLCIDLFCGLGGWADGFLAEGYGVVGFDIERHVYGDQKYPAQLVLQDVLTLSGSQFTRAAVIVASPPCQAYSYRAMPWKKAKALPPPDNSLFEACFRIAKEAGVPIVVENVKGAQPWVGSARWHYGSFYLWGDVPALMPFTTKSRKCGESDGLKVPGIKLSEVGFNVAAAQRYREGIKQHGSGAAWFDKALDERRKEAAAVKNGKDTFGWPKESPLRNNNSKSDSRKAASAMIAKIPFDLSQWIARCFKS